MRNPALGNKSEPGQGGLSPRIATRILSQFSIFLLLVMSPAAFARGGPGGAFGVLLEWMLIPALVSGIVVGAIVGWRLGRTPWKAVALILVLLLGVGVVEPLFGVLIGLPIGVFVAIFATVTDVVRSGLLTSRANHAAPLAVDGAWPAAVRGLLRWGGGTYLFWAIVSFSNFDLLGFLTVPPLVIAFPGSVSKFLPFILPPLVIALASGGVVIAILYTVRRGLLGNDYVAVFIFNASVLFVFFVSAEVYRDRLMSEALNGHEPVDLHSASFLDSVLSYRTYFRPTHAGFVEEGRSYHWSYAERKFTQ